MGCYGCCGRGREVAEAAFGEDKGGKVGVQTWDCGCGGGEGADIERVCVILAM